MRRKTRQKINKALIISGIVLLIIAIIVSIIIFIKLNKKEEISYEDIIVGKNYFEKITVDLSNKEVLRDGTPTTLQEEFGIPEEQENLIFTSQEEFNNFINMTSFDVTSEGMKYTLTNAYQTKTLIVKADSIKGKVEGQENQKIFDGLYMLKFQSEKLTKAMYTYYLEQSYVDEIYTDKVIKNSVINDESQTMYGENIEDIGDFCSWGVPNMGFDNYQKIINDNGNPKDIVISTIGYGIQSENEFFNGRIQEGGYNFIKNSGNTAETIPQGSRIAEVLVDCTTPNIKILPIVAVDEDGYTSISSIVKSIAYATKKSDVICYELINEEHPVIDMALDNAFKEEVPFCSVLQNGEENYPANHGKTIATSSIDKSLNITAYSGQGDFIDFSAASTDVKEIFNTNSTVSRWSGPQYSNAYIVSAIAMIKTYDKDATILDIYNFLRNFCQDLGDIGKDKLYGYGCPKFSNLTIADIDKENPKIIEVKYENETWEVLKQISINAEDNIRIYAWTVTENENISLEDTSWNVLEGLEHTLDTTYDITKNGTYYVLIRDSAGNIEKQQVQIDKVDNTPPKIAYDVDKNTLDQGYVTISFTAEDNESGLSDSPYSFDKSIWGAENTRQIKQNGRYKVYAVDNLGNTAEQEIVIDCFSQEGVAEIGTGTIIQNIHVSADWNENVNNNVQITLNANPNIVGWQITSSVYAPTDFVTVNQEIEPERNEDESIENNTNTTNTNTTNTTTNSTNTNTNTVQNTIQENTSRQDSSSTREQVPTPIVINTSLNVNTTYYLWIKEKNGVTSWQTFSIARAQV